MLDFGLAKKESGPQELTDTATQSLISAPGMVLGTVPYMSPEQLRGQEVDGRSDLWSLGVVLYEIVAGRKPFAGATTNDTIAAILQNEPAPLDNAPLQLRRIVSRALAKQLDERYPTANEMLLDLQNLRRDLDSGAVFANSVAPDAEVEHETRRLPAATGNLDGADTSRSMSSAEYLVTEIQRHRRGALAALLALLLVGAALGYYFTRPAPANVAQETAALDSLAVLPFANAAQDPSAEYLSDGITGSLINSLSQLPGLKVMSLSAVFRYKGQATDALKVGQELNVRAVLQGSVKQIGDQLAINVELVDTLDNHQIWGEQYVRKFADVLTVQSEIAQEVSSKLRLKLTSAQQQQLTKRDTDNAEAYREYLKGRFYTLQYTPEGHKKALEHLNKAIAIDPTYALAYAGVADAYTTISDSFLSPREALSKAKAAAQKALDLDDKIAEAWAARGHARLHEWDPAALDDLRKALELAPNSLTNQLWLGEYYMIWDVGKSVEVLEKAAELDPLSAIPPAFLSFDYYMLRQPEKAIENGKKAIELNPGFYTENAYLARIYASRGDLKSALETINKVPPEALNGMAVSTKGYLFAVQGKRREAEQTIAEMQKMSATQYVSPFEFAIVYMALNNRDPTFFYLNKAYEDRSENLGFIRTMPLFDSVRDDPRYADLLRRIGLPQ